MTTLERLEKILDERYRVPRDRITLDEPIEALGLDSLGMTELLFFIEEEFEISLPYEPVAMRTVGDAVRYVDEVLAARPPGASRSAAPAVPAEEMPLQASRERPA
ncbi:MAG: acyl carrier protein [Steroidobacteraceae bacterium]